MREYQLRPREIQQQDEEAALLEVPRDNGNRTLKVYTLPSVRFLQAASQRRGLAVRTVEEGGAFHLTLQCSKAELEAVREEFNTRPL